MERFLNRCFVCHEKTATACPCGVLYCSEACQLENAEYHACTIDARGRSKTKSKEESRDESPKRKAVPVLEELHKVMNPLADLYKIVSEATGKEELNAETLALTAAELDTELSALRKKEIEEGFSPSERRRFNELERQTVMVYALRQLTAGLAGKLMEGLRTVFSADPFWADYLQHTLGLLGPNYMTAGRALLDKNVSGFFYALIGPQVQAPFMAVRELWLSMCAVATTFAAPFRFALLKMRARMRPEPVNKLIKRLNMENKVLELLRGKPFVDQATLEKIYSENTALLKTLE
jgi:hypothetical protein